MTLVTLLFDFAHYRKPSRLILRLYDFLTTRRMHIYLPLSEIPGPRQKAGAVHELKPLSIPPVTSGNLRDPVFAPGSLGLICNTWLASDIGDTSGFLLPALRNKLLEALRNVLKSQGKKPKTWDDFRKAMIAVSLSDLCEEATEIAQQEDI